MDSNLRDRMLDCRYRAKLVSRKGFPAHLGSILTVQIGSISFPDVEGFLTTERRLRERTSPSESPGVSSNNHPTPTSGLGAPTGCESHRTRREVSRIATGPLAHTDLGVSALSVCTLTFSSGLAICTQEALKNPRRVFHISQMPPRLDLGTPGWCCPVISGSPSYCNL